MIDEFVQAAVVYAAGEGLQISVDVLMKLEAAKGVRSPILGEIALLSKMLVWLRYLMHRLRDWVGKLWHGWVLSRALAASLGCKRAISIHCQDALHFWQSMVI